MARAPLVAMNDPKAVHCSLDIETLGSRDDAPIVQIGAVLFNPWGTARGIEQIEEGSGMISAPGTEFNMHLQIENPSGIDPDTLRWWMAQGQDAQQRVFGRGLDRHSLMATLEAMRAWSYSWTRSVDFWWSDMDFDLRIMRAAWKRCYVTKAPYGTSNGPHRGVRDVRTIKAVGRDMGLAEPIFVGVEHDALDDAHHQAILVSNVLRKIIPLPLGQHVVG